MGMADLYGQRVEGMSHPWTNVSGPVIRMGGKEVLLQDLVNERNEVVAYLRTMLDRAGFQDLGGQEWKPPLGKVPDYIAGPPPTDAQVEALARVLHEADETHSKRYYTWESRAESIHEDYRVTARAAFAHFGAVPETEPIADADTLEELTEIGNRAHDEVIKDLSTTDLGHAEVVQRATLAQTAAILRAAHGCPVAMLAPERPKGLPTAEELRAAHLQYAQDYEAGKNDGSMCASDFALNYLAPYLREPVGCTLDVTADELHRVFCDHVSENQEGWPAVFEYVKSRIRPVFECDCSAIREERDLLKVEYESRQIMINNVKAALEGRPFNNKLEGE